MATLGEFRAHTDASQEVYMYYGTFTRTVTLVLNLLGLVKGWPQLSRVEITREEIQDWHAAVRVGSQKTNVRVLTFFYHSLRLFLMIVMDKKNVQFTLNFPDSQLYLSIGSQQLDQSPSPSDSGKLTQLTPRFWRCLRSSSLIGLRRAECWWTTWANGFPFFSCCIESWQMA